TNRPVFNYRSNGLSITSSGNELEKMQANLGYERWLRAFLEQHVPHPSEAVVYRTLVSQQAALMRQRKRYTMALSMRSGLPAKCWMWLKHRRRFGLTLTDIAVAAAKSRGLRKKLAY